MSKLTRSDGIVLRSLRHGETSLILTVFMRSEGKVGLMAKGARAKKKTGQSAGYELFTEAQFVYYHKSGRDLQLLKEAAIVNAHLPLRDSLELMSTGSAVIELLMRCSREDDPHPELYDSASATLKALDERPSSPLPLIWKFEVDLFQTLGFALQLDTCAATGKPFVLPLNAAIPFRYADGTFTLPAARGNREFDGEMSPECFAILSRLPAASAAFTGKLKVSPRAQFELSSFFSRYLETHLSVHGRLRSLDALHWSVPA